MESTFIYVVRCWAEVNGKRDFRDRSFDNYIQAYDCAETCRKVFGSDNVEIIKAKRKPIPYIDTYAFEEPWRKVMGDDHSVRGKKMKQILSVADFATMLDLLNQTIQNFESPIISNWREEDKDYEKKKKEHLEAIKQNPYYKSLIHLKNALENLNIEVEVPDIDVKK